MNYDYDMKKKFELLDTVGFKEHFKADSWEDFNRQFFDGLAPKYDRLNEVLSLGQHRRHKRHAVQSACIKPGDRVLDLCTGSGDLAIYIARKYPSVQVIAVDASAGMLEIARKRAAGLSRIEFRQGDALRLDFPDDYFDVTMIGFGLRNLLDLKAGLKEMQRVTKTGGRVVNLDLGTPKGKFLQAVHEIYFRRFIPFLGRTFFHRNEFNSFKYLPESGRYFPPQDILVEIFKETGYRQVKNRNFMLGAVAEQVAIV